MSEGESEAPPSHEVTRREAPAAVVTPSAATVDVPVPPRSGATPPRPPSGGHARAAGSPVPPLAAPAPAPSPVPGSRGSFGRFTITGELGRGGYGIVYRAHDPTLARPVALKVLRDEVADGPARDRLVREARAVARLGKHPHVVQVHEAGELHDGQVFIAMELVLGESLERHQARRRFEWREAAAIVRKVALGLHHAHRVGLVHRDVKPSNVILDAGGEPQITDFGVAKDLESGSASITRSGAAVGTPAFMSPEQAQALPVDARCDVYGAGALLYALVRGQAPFRAPHVAMLLTAVIEQEPPPLRSGGTDCPRDLETVVQKAMAKEPGRRYASALLLAEDLARVLRGEPCLARRPNVLEAIAAHFYRHPRNFVLLLGIIGAGAVTYLYRVADDDRSRLQELDRKALLAEELRVGLSAAPTTGAKRSVCDEIIARLPVAWQPFHERGLLDRTAALEHTQPKPDRPLPDVEGAALRYVTAEEWLTIALGLAIDPDAPAAEAAPRFWRGMLRLEGLDDLEGGRRDLLRAAELYPGSALARTARYAASAAPEALPPAETAGVERDLVREQAFGVVRVQRALVLSRTDPPRALAEAQAAARSAPLLARAHDLAARLQHEAGDEAGAQASLAKAAEVRAAIARARASRLATQIAAPAEPAPPR